MDLREMLFTNDYIELTFPILRAIVRTPIGELKSQLIEKESGIFPEDPLQEVSSKYDLMHKRVIHEIYAENIVMGSGFMGTELEEGETWNNVKSIWKVTPEKQARWDDEEAEDAAWFDSLTAGEDE